MKNVDEKKKSRENHQRTFKALLDGGYIEGVYITKGSGYFYQLSLADPCLTNQGQDLLQADSIRRFVAKS